MNAKNTHMRTYPEKRGKGEIMKMYKSKNYITRHNKRLAPHDITTV